MIAPVVRAAALAILIGGCALPQAEVSPEGSLEVFGPASVGTGTGLPRDWVLEADRNPDPDNNILIERDGNNVGLLLKTGPSRFVLARRTKASLLASPYIGWSWRVDTKAGHGSDIRLLVGFYGGDPESRSWGAEPFARLGTALPPFDRAIAIVWGRSALERGSFSTAGPIPEYIARGGREHEGQWWTDNLDLSALYRKAWPGDRLERVRIMFVGFAVSDEAGPAEARFGEVGLYR